jgi:hypothetical protein
MRRFFDPFAENCDFSESETDSDDDVCITTELSNI